MGDSSQSLETIRRRIEHEDNLVNQRVSWIVGSQAFLLTGYAILLNGAAQTAQARGDEQVAHDQALLIKLIPFTSICVTALLWFGILAGIWAIRDLRAWVKTLPGFDASQVQALGHTHHRPDNAGVRAVRVSDHVAVANSVLMARESNESRGVSCGGAG